MSVIAIRMLYTIYTLSVSLVVGYTLSFVGFPDYVVVLGVAVCAGVVAHADMCSSRERGQRI